jgi:hypothetical protein
MTTREKIIQIVVALPEEEQNRLLDYLQRLPLKTPVGTPGKDLLFIAGRIPKDDLEIMRRAVDEDCEQIDYDSW